MSPGPAIQVADPFRPYRGPSSRLPRAARRTMVSVPLVLLLLLAACQTKLHGTDMGKQPATDFQLVDQFGRQVALSDFRGRPLVLTFLYTACPDVCPLTAERLRLTAQLLGPDAERVGMLAVSTDPVQDSVEAAYRFSSDHGLLERWHFLIGDRGQLERVWQAYYVAAFEVDAQGVPTSARSPGGRVGHTDALYLIDKQGNLRSLLRADFDHTALAQDLRALLRE